MVIYSTPSILNINDQRSSGSGKANSSLNLKNHQPDTDKIHLYAKDSLEASYLMVINKRKSVGLKHDNDSKVFIDYSNLMQDVYKIIDAYNPGKRQCLTVFHYKICDITNLIQ